MVIARDAGINLSNLYHYFASKDELFHHLVKPATDVLETMLNEHHGIKGEDVLGMQEERYVEVTLEEYMGAIRKYKSLLKLLLLKSQGSSLEGYKEYYVEKSTRLVLTIPVAILAMRLAERVLNRTVRGQAPSPSEHGK